MIRVPMKAILGTVALGALVGGCNPSGERSLGKNILLGAVARISGLEQDQRLCLFCAPTGRHLRTVQSNSMHLANS